MNLRLVFEWFKKVKLKFNFKKCIFFKDEVLFFGYVVFVNGIYCDL